MMWIKWNGDATAPVAPETPGIVKLANGTHLYDDDISRLTWKHGFPAMPNRYIIAYATTEDGMSYLSRHRPICAVLQEIREVTQDEKVIKLVDEAVDYARRMSDRLMEYKRAEETITDAVVVPPVEIQREAVTDAQAQDALDAFWGVWYDGSQSTGLGLRAIRAALEAASLSRPSGEEKP